MTNEILQIERRLIRKGMRRFFILVVAKDNKKFRISKVAKGARFKDYLLPVVFLCVSVKRLLERRESYQSFRNRLQKIKYLGGEKKSLVWYALDMKRKEIKIINYILITGLAITLAGPASESVPVQAATIKDIQDHIDKTQNELNEINDKISHASDEQDIIEEKIADLNAEIINTMTSIGVKEDEIAAKEAEINNKQVEINQAQQDYEAAKAREEQQYQDMVLQIREMYEKSQNNALSVFFEGESLSDILNRMVYIEKVYGYSREKLDEFVATKNQVQELWDFLVAEKTQLETDKSQLEADRAELQSQKSNLDTLLAQKKQESSNFEAEIKKYQQEAAVYKKMIQQDKQELKRLQKQQSGGGSTGAANGNYQNTSYTGTIDGASGSDAGKKIAKYACQFIGNPYVPGGTSLTNGADCSGFTYRLYQDFGYSIPRTSYSQRSAGTGVSYDEAQPGDLICYDGHVGMYIGGGLIVHASTQKTGIKVSKAQYRPILAVRRIM